MAESRLQFSPFRSFVDLSFFQVLSAKKLNEYKLDASEKRVTGIYNIPVSLSSTSSSLILLNGDAFDVDSGLLPVTDYTADGLLLNFNTIDDFRNSDKAKIIQDQGKKLWESIANGQAEATPSILASFYLITFSDLKKFKFYYWFAFPAIHSDWIMDEPMRSVDGTDISNLVSSISEWSSTVDPTQRGFFLLKSIKSELRPSWTVGKLSEWEGFWEDENITVGFCDPSTLPQNPGWLLRNFLAFLKHKGVQRVKVLCYRDLTTLSNELRSRWISLKRSTDSSSGALRVTGWERITTGNSAPKVAPKMADLGSLMDPKRLADQSVDLNLKLMRWRIAPDLDIDKVKHTRCLLLGAGTLGSYVSRCLMAWGVRKITFIDNSSVSYSNPVRQSLYTFDDCKNGGAMKAKRAAQALAEIYPGVDSTGYSLNVPMIGHPVTSEQVQRKEYEDLVELIDSHDAVFLLMDSREARWLPTVIACAKNKIVINAALGFDSYVVMRHGSRLSASDRLGCYFCNDIYAPSDSLADRTLDQMCTVTRPGVALLASGLAVELFVSVVQHPDGPAAMSLSTSTTSQSDEFEHPLGVIPHQIRGFLHSFEQLKISGPNSSYCSACSEPVLKAWEAGGWEFVMNALNVPNYVDEVSGLADVQRKADEITTGDNWSFDIDDEDDTFD